MGKQHMLEVATGKSVWGSPTVQIRLEGCHWDKMAQLVYRDEVYKEKLVDGF